MDSRLVSALVSRWERRADSREALVAEIEAVADAAWELIQAGSGEVSFVKTSNLNSKSVNLDPVLTADKTLILMEEALGEKLSAQVSELKTSVGDVKSSVARIEGWLQAKDHSAS